jgi:glycosyltransferase involved in cell wall biosynthesis
MRILFFLPLGARSGSEVALYNLICYAAGKGWDVGVACRVRGELLDQLPASVPVFIHETSSPLRRGYAAVSRRLLGETDGFPAQAHARFKPDVWYVNTITQPWIVKQAETKKIPCVLHTHELEQVLGQLTENDVSAMVNYPRLVVASSQAALNVFKTLGRHDRIELIYATIDPTNIQFDPNNRAALRQSLGIAGDTFVWTMVGSVDPNKNPLRFIEIAAEMLRAGLPVHFVWIGGGDAYEIYVKKRIDELGLTDKVSFIGARSKDYYDWLNAADGLVITSHKESLSLVALEMSYLGKPVVSFPCGGVSEIIREGMGVVIDSWNNKDLIEAMVRAMRGEIFFDPQVGRERIKEFSIETQGPRWLELLQQTFSTAGSTVGESGE